MKRTLIAFTLKNKDKSETRMIASVLKQDINTHKVQKNTYLLEHKHTVQIFRVIPFVKLQNNR